MAKFQTSKIKNSKLESFEICDLEFHHTK